MTGWRIGWAVAPRPVAKFMGDLQSQETSNPCSISQWAALEAITGPQDSVAAMKAAVRQAPAVRPGADRRLARRDLRAAGRGVLRVHERLGPLRPDARRAASITDSTSFCLTALAQAHVALVMGSAFGAEGYARLSFATDLATLEKGFDALRDFLRG